MIASVTLGNSMVSCALVPGIPGLLYFKFCLGVCVGKQRQGAVSVIYVDGGYPGIKEEENCTVLVGEQSRALAQRRGVCRMLCLRCICLACPAKRIIKP